MTTVIALGGNALIRPGERGTAAEQRANLRATCAALRPLLADGELVVTHGNGPQVGNELVRQERAADEVPPLPLYLAVAQTQAEIGALIESELAAVADRPVVCVLTHVSVDEDDPAFERPTKPVGPFYAEEQARAHYGFGEQECLDLLTQAAHAGLLREGIDPAVAARQIVAIVAGNRQICDALGERHDLRQRVEQAWQLVLPAIATDTWLAAWRASR